MARFLVANDGGVHAEGIHALATAETAVGEAFVVDPMSEAITSGHDLTIRRPLYVEQLSEHLYGVDGTPTDNVNIAVNKLLPSVPDILVSGINNGWNLRDDVTYSGRVAAA